MKHFLKLTAVKDGETLTFVWEIGDSKLQSSPINFSFRAKGTKRFPNHVRHITVQCQYFKPETLPENWDKFVKFDAVISADSEDKLLNRNRGIFCRAHVFFKRMKYETKAEIYTE